MRRLSVSLLTAGVLSACVAYLLISFPYPPTPPAVHASLSTVPQAWAVYSEDFYPGGDYATLPHGKEDGDKVVLIHGLSIPAIIWKNYLYGRGYSDAPQVTYDVSLYTTQLALLMQHVHWDNAHIVGLSMGGGIAAAFATQFPQLVNGKVSLIASAGIIESNDISRTAKIMSSPLTQIFSSLPPFQYYMRRLANSSSLSQTNIDPIQEIVRLQSAHLPYYNAAVASSLRDGPVRGLESSFAALSNSSIQVVLIHGTADKTVPYKYTCKILALVPHAYLHTVDGAGHDITVTHGKLVAKILSTRRTTFIPSGTCYNQNNGDQHVLV
ncbi:Alpha/Beta hydrolase protein [Pisolithus orientalis]|uniref:Alpha/Beta hydrolase protein n=1 Tax=Pisolithus orientalis TaxID=936130 RepID=UPI002224C220|nr:Alpha/Beta hydrolase protein [Pisolithus orientalis]KAI5999807.1 Alpha/Beta hydrolase protein [Pisolithus orientalis]